MKQEVIGWQWHQLDHMQIICTSLQTDNNTSTSSLNFCGQMLFLPPTNSVKALKAHLLYKLQPTTNPQQIERTKMVLYRDDDKVEPAPGVSEVLLEAVRRPLHDHLTHEYDAERLVHELQHHLQRLPIFNVHVLNCLPLPHFMCIMDKFM